MMNAAEVSGILDAVYDSAVFPDRWPQALERLGQAFDCRCVALIDRNLRTLEARVDTSNVDASSQREFLDFLEFARPGPPAHAIMAAGRGRTRSPDRAEIQRSLASDYYNGFMKPRDMHGLMPPDAGAPQPVSHHHQPGASAFSVEEFDANSVEQCRVLMPHLQRASNIRFQDRTCGGVAGWALRSGRPVGHRGAAAGAWRSGEIRQQGGAHHGGCRGISASHRSQIEIPDRNENATFHRLAAGATRRNRGHRSAARRRRCADARFGRNGLYGHHCTGEARDVVGRERAGGARAHRRSRPDADAVAGKPLSQLFGFSASETRVAERLMTGDSPEQAAAFLEVKISTVRWHLASMYRKTGSNRQAELVRLLLSLGMI